MPERSTGDNEYRPNSGAKAPSTCRGAIACKPPSTPQAERFGRFQCGMNTPRRAARPAWRSSEGLDGYEYRVRSDSSGCVACGWVRSPLQNLARHAAFIKRSSIHSASANSRREAWYLVLSPRLTCRFPKHNEGHISPWIKMTYSSSAILVQPDHPRKSFREELLSKPNRRPPTSPGLHVARTGRGTAVEANSALP
jgi:hypothetical protein